MPIRRGFENPVRKTEYVENFHLPAREQEIIKPNLGRGRLRDLRNQNVCALRREFTTKRIDRPEQIGPSKNIAIRDDCDVAAIPLKASGKVDFARLSALA